jgi:hypothetical protein
MDYCTSTILDGPSEEPPGGTGFSLDGWSTLAQDNALPEFDMPDFSESTSPDSEVNSQSTDGPSDIFAQLEINLELQSGIMDDNEGVDLSPISCQANIDNMTDEISLSPHLLSWTVPAMITTLPVPQSAGLASNNLQSAQTSHPAVATTSTCLSTSASTARDRPRRGRGRTKLPEEKLKSV